MCSVICKGLFLIYNNLLLNLNEWLKQIMRIMNNGKDEGTEKERRYSSRLLKRWLMKS